MKNFLLYLTFISIFKFSYSQELPPIQSFSVKEYNGENQNWDITQAENNYIYIANNKGLLEYNGANWNLYETPNETIMRSVKAFKGKVYTGFYMDFGFWKKNDFGILEYTSIVDKLGVKMLEDEQIWTIIEIDGWMLFKSLDRIYLYNLINKEIKIIGSSNKINLLTKVNDVIYFQEIGKGVFKIENGSPKLISDHQILKENFLVNIFSKDDKILFLTQQNGFFFLENSFPVKWKNTSENILNNKTIYSAKKLKNSDFIVGTISDGFLYFDNKGAFKYQLTQRSGLLNNTVLSVFEDNENNLWLGLDNGINCVNNTSPLRTYSRKSDFLGTIYSSIVFQGNLYLGTNQGLFYKKNKTNDDFKFVEGTQGQVWKLVNIDDILFCGHDSGTFVINNNTARKIFSKSGVWDFKKINDEKIIQGCYNGLYILEKNKNEWILKNKIQGFNNSSKQFVFRADNEIFVNHEYKGIFRILLDKSFNKVLKLSKETSVAKGIHSSLVKYQEKILYASKKGVFSFNYGKNTFERDSVFSRLISEKSFISAQLVKTSNGKKIWSFNKDNIKYLTLGKLSNTPFIKNVSISEFFPKGASGYENIINLENKKYLIGTSNGYLTIDLNDIEESKRFNVYINSIKSFEIEKPKKIINKLVEEEFNYRENNISFSYNVPVFNQTSATKYQYKLDGFQDNWSELSDSNTVLFENLPYGDYSFKVRGLIGNNYSENTSSYKFTILRPWYLSNLAIILYCFCVLLVLYLLHISSKRYYKNQREKLLDKAKKEAELKELESSKEIIKLNNEKLRNDIDSKNRELATSTMNIIKKNEFLNQIKTELINGGEKNISQVVKIINKNLNNTDDWKMFQEAFNNADKNFLKKVKERHENLTPNDLRLCAYLRLNLSSKEIAPLLNISPRSVEVKRYRLRKKMNLSHDSNLTSYILEI